VKTKKEYEERVAELRDLIRRHEVLYYQHDRPEISDAEFDALMRELIALEQAHPELQDPHSPTQRVGGQPASGFSTVRHLAPMLSLDNSYTVEELKEFHARLCRALDRPEDTTLRYVTELKIDELKSKMVKRADAWTSFAEGHYSRATRVFNITKAAGLVNDTVLKPGQVFSMNGTLGPRTYGLGWKPAPAIIDYGQLISRKAGERCCLPRRHRHRPRPRSRSFRRLTLPAA
jgi:hypothetical protein